VSRHFNKEFDYEKPHKYFPNAYTRHIAHRGRMHCKRKRRQEYPNETAVSTAGTLNAGEIHGDPVPCESTGSSFRN